MRTLTYAEFFRNFVLRKKQDLMSPEFMGIAEVTLPQYSLSHFFPKNTSEIGPSTSEAFISNFPGETFVTFDEEYEPILSQGHKVAVEIRKAIQGYRASHYVYNWTRDIKTVYGKKDVLVVKSYGLWDKVWSSRPSIFIAFNQYFDHTHGLVKSIEEEAVKKVRKQFVRFDLPLNMPAFSKLIEDYDHYLDSFRDGIPHPNNQTVRTTKAEGCYWLIDMLGALIGDEKYSLWGNLSQEARKDLHFIFVSNSKCIILNFGMLLEWMEDLDDKKLDLSNVKEGESSRNKRSKRFNAVKRFYLMLLTLSRGSLSELDLKEAPQNGQSEEKDAAVAEGADSGEERNTDDDQGDPDTVADKAKVVAAGDSPSSLLDLFSKPDTSAKNVDDTAGGEGDNSHSEEHEEWSSEVDDSLLEAEEVVTDTIVKKDPYIHPEDGVRLALEERARNGSLTVAEQLFFMRKATQYKHIELENGQTLEEYMHIDPKELQSLKDDSKIVGRFNCIIDESMLQSRAAVLKKNYVKKFLHKDIVKMILGVQNGGVALNDFKREIVTGIEGEYDIYTLQLHPVDGAQSTHSFPVPRVRDDGTFVVDGVKSHLQIQRMELPIRKINRFKVALTSYYDAKLMVTRSQKVVDNLEIWMAKQIISKASKGGGIEFNRGNSANPDYLSPRVYSLLASKFQWIRVKGVTLNFNIEKLLEAHPEFKKYTKTDQFLIGVEDGKPLTIDSYGNLSKDGQAFDTVEGLLGISMINAPIEKAVINITGYQFPIGVVLCYYFGIDELLKVTKATYRTVPMGTRPKLADDEYAITFNDEYLILSRREKFASLIFGGLVKLNNIGNFSRSDLNDNGIWGPLMGDPKVRASHFKEMKHLFDYFIDPITKEDLEKLGYSTSFHYLLLDAVRLLTTDQTRHEVELEEQRLVGYERFAGHIYRELVKSIRAYRNKGKERKHPIDINPDAVIMNILKDTSVNLVEEVNPIHQIKDQEEVTFGGTGGRSEITVVKRARVQQESYRGVISEANKDSSKVGFVTYATSDPRVADYRGHIAVKEKPTLTGLNSVTGNLAFGSSKDD